MRNKHWIEYNTPYRYPALLDKLYKFKVYLNAYENQGKEKIEVIKATHKVLRLYRYRLFTKK